MKKHKEIRAWIATKDRLPRFDIPVLACLESGYDGSLYILPMIRSYVENEGWYWCVHSGSGLDLADKNNYECEDDYDVRYWMPLPKPPKSK